MARLKGRTLVQIISNRMGHLLVTQVKTGKDFYLQNDYEIEEFLSRKVSRANRKTIEDGYVTRLLLDPEYFHM